MRCSCGGTFTAVAISRHRERDGRVPAPPGLKDRRVEERLDQDIAHRRRMEIAEDIGEGKGVLRPEREQQRVVGGRRLQLEVELPAEALAQGETPGLVDPAAERRVQHELHPARLVEEAFEHQRVLRRQHAEGAASLGQ